MFIWGFALGVVACFVLGLVFVIGIGLGASAK